MPRRTQGTLYKRNKRSKRVPKAAEETTPGRYWLEYYANGTRFRQPLKKANGDPVTRREEAVKARDIILQPLRTRDEVKKRKAVVHALQDAEEAVQEAVEARRKKLSLADAWAAYKADPTRPQSGQQTMADYKSQWECFVRWKTQEPANVAVEEIAPVDARGFVAHLTDKGLSANRYNKYLATMRLVFRTLAPQCNDMPNPFASITNRKLQTHSHRELSEAELSAVCQSASGELRLLLATGLYTALRLGDVCTLRWDEVKLDLDRIVRVPSKTKSRTGKTLVIPLHPVLKAILEETPKGQRRDYVLPDLAKLYDGGSPAGTSRVSKIVRNHFAACEIETQEKHDDQQRATCRVGFHSLRHSFVTLCAKAGVPLPVVQELCGHESPAIQQAYIHIGPEAAQTAINALPSIAESTSDESENAAVEAQRTRALELLKGASATDVVKVLNILNAKRPA